MRASRGVTMADGPLANCFAFVRICAFKEEDI